MELENAKTIRIRAAVVDDQAEMREEIRGYLEQYGKEKGIEVEPVLFTDGWELTEDYQADFDVIFMDIEMVGQNGMEAAARVREMDPDVVIVFVTNVARYAVEGYKVGALDYILKPLNYYSFVEKLDRIAAHLREQKKRSVRIHIPGETRKIEISSIEYVSLLRHDLIFHCIGGEYRMRGSIREAEEMLSAGDFFRCGSGFLVNLAFVKGVQNTDVILSDTRLPLSRARKKEFMQALSDYILRE